MNTPDFTPGNPVPIEQDTKVDRVGVSNVGSWALTTPLHLKAGFYLIGIQEGKFVAIGPEGTQVSDLEPDLSQR